MFIFSGYFILWLLANNCHEHDCYLGIDSSFFVGFLACFLWGFGAGWLDVAVIATSVNNFAHNRGTVLSLVKSMYGLGSGVMTQIYFAFISPNQVSFILFLALFCAVVAALLMAFIRPITPPATAPPCEARLLRIGLGGVVLAALYVLVVSVVRAQQGELSKATNVALGLVLCGYLGLLWLLAPLAQRKEQEAALGAQVHADDRAQPVQARASPGRQLGPWAAMQTLDFWLLCFAVFAGTGAGLTVNNNLSQIVKSQHGSTNAQDVIVSLFSVANSLSRVVFGASSDFFDVRRPMYLVLAVVGMGVTLLLLAFATLEMMYVLIPMAGFWYGAFWVVQPAITSDLFGVDRFGANYGLVQTAVSLGALLLSVLLTSYWYDDHEEDGTNSCTGRACFQAPFLIISGCCLGGSMAAAWLFVRTGQQQEQEQYQGLKGEEF
eukprot:TRINITY_DN32398_c0_g1_i1.p1 TRINITY_DN32398_c0_g1~~TRINITY_DN32398_c0_g1_i1.p1  ORF type:complete len:436 (+),score=122.84 TRINITY_DN32398_c0_g1_i1:151-1458(+)